MEREKFKKSWKDAFDKAEVSPSDKVWTNIELNLEKANGGQLKRRLMFYQMLAAASVVLAMTIGGVGYYYSRNQMQSSPGNDLAFQTPSTSENKPSTAETNTSDQTEEHPSNVADNTTRGPEHGSGTKREHSDPQSTSQPAPSTTVTKQGRNAENNSSRIVEDKRKAAPAVLAISKSRADNPELPTEIRDHSFSPIYTPRQIELNIPDDEETVDPVVAMLARLEQREKEVQGEEKDDKDTQNENLWTSVGFAAGSFNTVQSSGASPAPPTTSTPMALAAPIVDQETKASGYSYSLGVNVGKKLSERWVLQGGVNYLTHLSEYTANNVVMASNNYQQQRFRATSTNELIQADAGDLSNKIVYTAPYSVNNSMRYLSIPMQAGYLLINKTFGLQLNAGVATDLFLNNTIEADSDQLDKTSQPGGSDSPYRSVNLSGLVGTEFSYRFGDHYRISLNPGLRYPFNTIYKSELGVQSAPLTFDVGLRFRYIFH